MKNIWSDIESAKKFLKSIAVENKVPNYTEMRRKYGYKFRFGIIKIGGYTSLVENCNLNINNCYKSSDGHILSSYYEYLFDEYLYLNNIPHTIDGFICAKCSKHRYDFKINDVYVEIWGITNKQHSNYCKTRSIKEKLYKGHNLKLISIEASDYKCSSKELQQVFKNKLKIFNIDSNDNQIKYPVFNSRKIGYWNDKNIIKELEEVIKTTSCFPTSKQLFNLKRFDLGTAIVKHGGYRRFAQILGYMPKTKKYSEEYVVKELKEVKEQLGHFPCDRELQELQRSDLAGMIKSHGGYGYFKELVEGARDKKPFGYWKDENNIIEELKIIVNKLGRFPKYAELGQVAKGIDKSKKGMKYFEEKLNEKIY